MTDNVMTGDRTQIAAAKVDRVMEPCTLVLFGASGDLTQRMVMPAIFRLVRGGVLSPEFRVIGYARSKMTAGNLHGVAGTRVGDGEVRDLRYLAGVFVLDRRDPRLIRYRSPTPILEPELRQEREGAVAEVVFPAGVDRRSDLGLPSRVDIYYGMADSRIGAARLDVPVLGER